MKTVLQKLIFLFLTALIFLIAKTSLAQSVQLGVFQSGSSNILEFRVKPSQAFTGNNDVLANWQFAVRSTSSLLTGTITQSTSGTTGANYGALLADSGSDGTYNYWVFSTTAGPTLNMSSGQEYVLFTVRVNGSGSANFELSNATFTSAVNGSFSYPFYFGVDINGNGETDEANGFYQSSVTGVPLPVTLLSFDVYKSNETSAQLNWATASELNNKGFYIERSTDGRVWNVIHFEGTKAENGNSQQPINYSFTDADVFKPWSRTNTFYYRLRQQDFNGAEEFVGGVRSVRFGAESQAAMVQFGPNPASDHINIKSNVSGNLSVVITDLAGKQMTANSFTGKTQLNVKHFSAGLYMLTVKNASGEVIATEKLNITR